MNRSTSTLLMTIPLLLLAVAADVYAQQPPYDVFPPAEPPYYRVRYEASAQKGELVYPVNYAIWIPKGVKSLRGVIVHQHGCGEGSCKSGLTGAYDLHWQALAKKHDCALLAPTYEQPDKADCQMWCDPRNGSSAAFQKCLVDLGAKSGHPELAKVPWALWGHSGGGHWAGGMVLLHPERIAAAWLRSGVPLLKEDPKRAAIKAHTLPDAALKVPVMCNLGTKEGVTVKDRFAGVWTANETFFNELRSKGGLICVAIDPLSSHDCGNQRYLAIPWLDACLDVRLPKVSGDSLHAMPTDREWLAPIMGGEAVRAAKFTGDPLKAAWLPNEAVAKAWMQYVKDTNVADSTPPPAPTNLHLKGDELAWEADADLESGLANFIIERDGKFLAKVPEQSKNPFGRPIFQNLQYSDTPTQPLVPMRYTDTNVEPGKKHTYRVIAVNTVGLKSTPSAEPRRQDDAQSSLSPWKANVKVSAVSANDHHSIHSYFNTSPESPDGRWILYYASTTADSHDGEIRIRERATGKETVLARDISCEDAHRAACQQWVSGGRGVVFHNVLKSGEWVVMCVDVATGKERLLAKGRQLGFGQPTGDIVPIYGPHWNPGDHRGLELLNVVTGKIEPTALTPESLRKAYPDWVQKTVGAKPFSLFFPLLSPDLSRIIFKIATPAGGDFRSKLASVRTGLFIYDLKHSRFLHQHDKWGHPAWHPNSRDFINAGGVLTSTDTENATKIPGYRIYSGDHPSYSPDGKLYTTDTTAEREPFNGVKGTWAVVVGDIRTGETVVIRKFDNSKGARSWRVSHPHPSFSPDGRRLYFNASDGQWTRLYVAEVSQ